MSDCGPVLGVTFTGLPDVHQVTCHLMVVCVIRFRSALSDSFLTGMVWRSWVNVALMSRQHRWDPK